MILLKMALSTINQSIQYLSLFISDGIISSKYYSKKKYIVVVYDELSKATLSQDVYNPCKNEQIYDHRREEIYMNDQNRQIFLTSAITGSC